MKRHKFPLLLVVVIFTAICITGIKELRPKVAADTGDKAQTRTVVQPTLSGPQIGPANQTGKARSTAARTGIESLRIHEPDNDPGPGVLAMSKSDGTN